MSHWAAQYAALIADNSIQGLLLADESYCIAHANQRAAEILGAKSASDLSGKVLHADETGVGIAFDRPFDPGAGEGPQSGRYTVKTEFGAVLPVHVEFFDGIGGQNGYFILLTDLSGQIDLESAALQSEKLAALDNIVAGIAHELNNPMTAILGYSELLLATEKDARRKQRVALIAEEADRCGKIISNMLTFTRSYGQALETENINAILSNVLSLHAYQMRVDHITIHTFLDGNVPDSQVQPAALRRLFMNIIHNAHQALLEKSELKRNFWVTTELVNRRVLIQISDDGPGIPKEVRHKIFDPFFTTREFGDGMGLGLSVSYGIVQQHRGRIWMEPRVGGGTAMNIEIPLSPSGD